MYKLDIGVDNREAAAIERRRNMEKQRQSRIFNPRERTIGIDRTSIENQVQEKKAMEDLEKQREAAFADEMIRNDKIASILEQRQVEEKRQLREALIEYRKEHQRDVDSREFDLNDPDAKKKDLATRVSDVDTRLNISGMQKFPGEDLQFEERKKLQQQQLREWTVQQMEEKERLKMEESKATELYNKKAIEIDQRAMELLYTDLQTRKAINIAMKEYNTAMANEKSFQKQQEIVQEQDDNYTELKNNINGDILTENPLVSQSAFGPNRVIPDRWKGMSPSQLGEILETQQLQCEEKQKSREEQKRIEDEWERRRLSQARAAQVKENQLKRKKEELKKQLAEENKQLSEEQRAKQRVLNTEVYCNVPNEGFFAQFGTSSR